MRYYHVLPLLAVFPSAAMAQSVTFTEALAAAERNAPSLEARGLTLEARRAEESAADELPDPRLSVGLQNFPISGPPAFTLNGTMMTMTRIGIEQELTNLAKRHARAARATADVTLAAANADVTAKEVRSGAATAWIDLAYAQRRLSALDTIVADLRRYAPMATSAVEVGAARPAESLEIQQSIAVLEDARSAIAADVGQARARLARWTGETDPQAAGPMPDLSVSRLELVGSLDRQPELGVATARTRSAEADVDLARAEKRPDFGVNVAYGHRDPAYGDLLSVGVSVTLPIFAGRRQEPRIAARRLDLAAARAETEDVRRKLLADLDGGLAEYESRYAQWQRARDVLLPLARKQDGLEVASFSAGNADLLDVIAAKTRLANIELTVIDREALVAAQAINLKITFGSIDR